MPHLWMERSSRCGDHSGSPDQRWKALNPFSAFFKAPKPSEIAKNYKKSHKGYHAKKDGFGGFVVSKSFGVFQHIILASLSGNNVVHEHADFARHTE